ncbi:MAG: hypothetical protein L6R48_19465 [Planctomycetes bacterium]|nr:hypothetical protein [Planctomycetota bacterium]
MRPVQLLPVIAFSVCLCLPVANRPRVLADLVAPDDGAPPSTGVVEARWRAAFPLRDEGRALVGAVRRQALGERGSPVVVVGGGGWLYYRGEAAGDGHSFDALRGLAAWSPHRGQRLAADLQRRADQVAAWGGRYLVVVAPDKAAVHPEGLPRYLRPVPGRSRADQLLALVPGLALDLRPALAAERAAQPALPLYWRSDSHWNEWGRLVAAQAIAARLGDGPAPALPSSGLRPVPVLGVPDPFDLARTRPGELYRLLERDGLAEPAWQHDIAVEGLPVPQAGQAPPLFPDPFGWQPRAGGHRVAWDRAFFLHTRCEGAPLPGRLLVLHDSFGSFPMGGLADRYREATFLWTHEWDAAAAERLRPAVVVHIVAERYLDALLP